MSIFRRVMAFLNGLALTEAIGVAYKSEQMLAM